eukprot:2150587-Pyramimonas_sp.AAC.1
MGGIVEAGGCLGVSIWACRARAEVQFEPLPVCTGRRRIRRWRDVTSITTIGVDKESHRPLETRGRVEFFGGKMAC